MEKLSVDKAISAGIKKIMLPSMAMLFGFIGSTLAIGKSFEMSSAFMISGLALGITSGWLWWSYSVVKWKVWAYPIVEDLHELKIEAIQRGLIWGDNSIFNKTEIWTQKEKETVQQAEDEYYNHPSVLRLWHSFQECNPEFKTHPIPESFCFCDNEKDANECADLVVRGIKQATSTSLWWFHTFSVPLPIEGDLNIITDWEGIARAVIRTTKVEQIAFQDIDEAYARIEGEGDQSLDYWRNVHWEYYTREMEPFEEMPSEDMIIVCQHFETLWK